MEWMDKLKDMIKKHIFTGLSETYRTVNNMTAGKRTLMAFQVALDGIRDLSRSKLEMDYKVLLHTLQRNNYDENAFEQTIKNTFYEYAKKALSSAGLNCDHLNLDLIDVPGGMDFVHSVYINTAREIWMQPHLYSHEYPASVQLENQRKVIIIIEGSIEKSIRDGVDLNKIITAYQTGAIAPKRRKVPEPTLKEQFNRINKGKTLLDDDSDHEEDIVVQVAKELTLPDTSGLPPPTPSTVSGATIDDDDLAPDTETMTESLHTVPPAPVKSDVMVIKVDTSRSIQSAQSARSNQSAKSSSKSEPKPKTKTESTSESESESESTSTSTSESESTPKSKSKSESKPNPNPKPTSKPTSKSKSTSTDTESETVSNSSSVAETIVETEPKVVKPRHHSFRPRPEPPKVVDDDLPDDIGELVKEVTEEGVKEIKIEAEDTETTQTVLDPDLEIMFKNSGKPKPKPKPEEDKDDPDVRSFEYVGSIDDSEGTISVKLLDEDDEMESRLSRLRKNNKNDIPGK